VSHRALNGTPLLSKGWRSLLIAFAFIKITREAPYRGSERKTRLSYDTKPPSLRHLNSKGFDLLTGSRHLIFYAASEGITEAVSRLFLGHSERE
jgi:hypothetical protein